MDTEALGDVWKPHERRKTGDGNDDAADKTRDAREQEERTREPDIFFSLLGAIRADRNSFFFGETSPCGIGLEGPRGAPLHGFYV